VRAPLLLERLQRFIIKDLANIVVEVRSLTHRAALSALPRRSVADCYVPLCVTACVLLQYLLGPGTQRQELSAEEQQLLLSPLKLPELPVTLRLSIRAHAKQSSSKNADDANGPHVDFAPLTEQQTAAESNEAAGHKDGRPVDMDMD